jgi:hypothetical protein
VYNVPLVCRVLIRLSMKSINAARNVWPLFAFEMRG